MTSEYKSTDELLRELRQLPSTDDDRALEALIAQFAEKATRGEIPKWHPSSPDPFGGNWAFLSHLNRDVPVAEELPVTPATNKLGEPAVATLKNAWRQRA